MANSHRKSKKKSRESNRSVETVRSILASADSLLRDLRRLEKGIQEMLVDVEPLRLQFATLARPLPPGFTRCGEICLGPDINAAGKIGCKACDFCTGVDCICNLFSFDSNHPLTPYMHEAGQGQYINRNRRKNYICICVKAS